MGTKHPDPWAPLPGFEPYVPPVSHGFDSVVDARATELASFLRSEIREMVGRTPESQTMVELPNGTRGQLTEKSPDSWELVIHLGRDLYKVITARTREQVLDGAV
jgi:hypothetical protein